MKAGDLILDAALVPEPDKRGYYLLLIVQTEDSREEAVRLHGNKTMLDLDIEGIKGCEVTLLAKDRVTGDLHFAFAKPGHYIEWCAEHLGGEVDGDGFIPDA